MMNSIKKLINFIFCLILSISLFSCNEKEKINISLEDINNIIQNHYEINEMDDNYKSHYIDCDNDVIVVELIDISENKQEEFIYNVFTKDSGSKYIKYLKDNSLLKFVESK